MGKWYRVTVYVCLWLVFFVPLVVRDRRGEKIPRWLHLAVWITGLFVAIEFARH